jgi:hypothetical protein
MRKISLIGEKDTFSQSIEDQLCAAEFMSDHNNHLMKFLIDHGYNHYGYMICHAFNSSNEEIFDYVLAKETWPFNPLCTLRLDSFCIYGKSRKMFLKMAEKAGIPDGFVLRALYNKDDKLIEMCLPYLSEEIKCVVERDIKR